MIMTKAKTKPEKEEVLEDTDTDIYEISEPPQLEIEAPLLIVLSINAEKFLTDDYVNDKKLQDKILEQRKEEYNFDELKNAFDKQKIPPQLDCFFLW